MIWVFAALFAVLCFFAWTIIHELSHVAAAKLGPGVEWWKIKPYPHKNEYLGFVWASCRYRFSNTPTAKQEGWINFAPRLPDFLAAVLFPLGALMPWPFALFWCIFFGAGLIDMFTGSLGISKKSDLQRMITNMRESGWITHAWAFRMLYWVTILISVGVLLLIIL